MTSARATFDWRPPASWPGGPQRAHRLARLVTAMVVWCLSVSCWAAGASAQSTPTTTSTPGVTLLSQDTVVTGSTSSAHFHLRLQLSGDTTGDTLTATIYPRLTNRTNFQASLRGRLYTTGTVLDEWKVSTLSTDPLGGVDASAPLAAYTLSTGVYPVQLQLFGPDGNPVGAQITTYLVYVAPGWTLPKLSVALILPIGEAPALDATGGLAAHLPPAQAAALARLTGALASSKGAPVSLALVPQTVAALAHGSPTERRTLNQLTAAIAANGDQVLPEPYVRLDLPAMLAAGLGGQLNRQLTVGMQVLGRWVAQPDSADWVPSGPLNQAVLGDLADRGATELVLPDRDLSSPPSAYQANTFAYPTDLAVPGKHVEVVGADSGLQAHFTNGPNQALDAYQLLAELAMIEVEKPALVRGVAVVPPAGWTPNATFSRIVLDGLASDPLVNPVSVSGLFAKVPAAVASDGATATRSLVAGGATARVSDVNALSRAVHTIQGQLGAYQDLAPSARSVIDSVEQELLSVESADLSRGQRSRLVSRLKAALHHKLDQVQLPTNISITLTSRQGAIPVTIVNNSNQKAHVRLELTSQKLAFDSFKPADGFCASQGPTAERCQLTLPREALTLRIPVEARASGVFGLSISLQTPDGAVTLGSGQYTVHSTAISSVGIILIVVAALFLALWWFRQRHRRRHAVALVTSAPPAGTGPTSTDPPAEEPPSGDPPPGDDPAERSFPAVAPARRLHLVGAAVSLDTGAAATTSLADCSGPDPSPENSNAEMTSPEESTEKTVSPERHHAQRDSPRQPGRDHPAAPQTEPRTWLDDDPVLAAFFHTPAPDYPNYPGLSLPGGESASPGVTTAEPSPSGYDTDTDHPASRPPPSPRSAPRAARPVLNTAQPTPSATRQAPSTARPASQSAPRTTEPRQHQPPITPADDRRSFSRNTRLVAAGIFCSRLTGFAKLLVLSWVLGIYRLNDAYNLANTVPNIVYNLVLGGVLSATLVPVFVEQLGRRDDEEGWHAVSAVVTIITVALLGLTAIFWFCARPIIDFYLIGANGRTVGDERAIGIHLLHFFVPQLFLLGGIAVTEALLNARRRFANPAFTPVLCNLVTIAAVIVTGQVAHNMSIGAFRTDEAALLVLGLGTTAGYLVQFGAQLPPLLREGFRLRPVWDLHHPAVRTVLRLSAWTFGAVVTNQVSLNLILVAASRRSGDVTAFNNAYNFFQFPYAIFAVSIAAVIAPDLAERWSRGDIRGFGLRVASGLRLTLAILIPAGLGYAVIAEPLMRLVLDHGAVTANQAHLIGAMLALFALGLPGFSAFLLLMRAYQSMQDTRSMFWLYSVENGLTVILAVALYPSLGVRGLVLGWVGAYTVVSVPAYLHVRRRSLGFGGNDLIRPLLRIVAAAAIMAAVIDVLGAVGPQSDGIALLVLRLVVEIGIGTLVYLGGVRLFRISEIGALMTVAIPSRRATTLGPQGTRRQSRSDWSRRPSTSGTGGQPRAGPNGASEGSPGRH